MSPEEAITSRYHRRLNTISVFPSECRCRVFVARLANANQCLVDHGRAPFIYRYPSCGSSDMITVVVHALCETVFQTFRNCPVPQCLASCLAVLQEIRLTRSLGLGLWVRDQHERNEIYLEIHWDSRPF